MADYFANLENNTDRTWTFCVYQTIPTSVGLDSVAWKQTTVPQSGFSGVTWEVFYNVALANYKQDGGRGVYTASQTLNTQLGTAWDTIWQDNVQQLVPSGSAPQPDMIVINNISGRSANQGIGMSGQGAIYQNDVLSGSTSQFKVTPTYWGGLFNNLVRGEVISHNVVVGPVKLQYPSGMNNATITANLDGERIVLSTSYSSAMVMSLEHVDARVKAIDNFQRSLAAR